MNSDVFKGCIHAQGLYGNEDGWALDVGYWDVTHYNKSLLKKYGMSIKGDLKVWGIAISTPDNSGLKVDK